MLFALLALQLRSASASDSMEPRTPDVERVGIPTGTSSSADSTSGSSSSDSKNSGVSESEGKVFKSFKIGKWKVKPYVQPGGGVLLNGSTLSGVAGLDAGFKYSRKKWAGDLYLGGSATIGDGTSGYEAHLGDDTGARLKYWGVTLGLQGAYSGYTFTSSGDTVKGAPSLSVPVKLVLGPKKYHLGVGVAPAFTFDDDRSVDWSRTDAIGFGDEFSWYVAGTINVKQVNIKIKFTQSVLADEKGNAIVTNTPTISLGVGDIISLAP